MTLTHKETYDGVIVNAELTTDYTDKTLLVGVLTIRTLDGDEIKAKLKFFGADLDRSVETYLYIGEAAGLEYDKDLERFGEINNVEVEFWVGEYNEKKYARINVPGSKFGGGTADPEAVRLAIQKIRVSDDDIPF